MLVAYRYPNVFWIEIWFHERVRHGVVFPGLSTSKINHDEWVEENMDVNNKDLLFLSEERYGAITRCLSDLRLEIGAECILLADISGQLIIDVGTTGVLDVTSLVSLQAGSFVSTFEMSKYLGEKEALNLSFHEGESYDVYSTNVGDKLFIMLIFDRRVQTSRIGVVWLYTKRTVQKLSEIMATSGKTKTGQVLDAEFKSSLSNELDNIFDSANDK